MNGRTCLITGATDGIGKEAAIELAKKGCNLILIGRSKEKGEKVVEQIRKVADNHVDIDYLIADLVLMKEVSRVADEISKKYSRIDVLLNNVGAYFTSRKVTEEGFERTFALNHLGYFLMTKKLLPLVENARAEFPYPVEKALIPQCPPLPELGSVARRIPATPFAPLLDIAS